MGELTRLSTYLERLSYRGELEQFDTIENPLSGFPQVGRLVNGFHPSALTVLASNSVRAGSAYLTNLLHHIVVRQRGSALVISGGRSSAAVFDGLIRLESALPRVHSSKPLSISEVVKPLAMADLRAIELFDARPSTLLEELATLSKHQLPDVVVLEQIATFDRRGDREWTTQPTRDEEDAERLASRLKTFARESGRPVLLSVSMEDPGPSPDSWLHALGIRGSLDSRADGIVLLAARFGCAALRTVKDPSFSTVQDKTFYQFDERDEFMRAVIEMSAVS